MADSVVIATGGVTHRRGGAGLADALGESGVLGSGNVEYGAGADLDELAIALEKMAADDRPERE
ncbi:hypothetical protein [Rhodococcus sp. T7]|uniref:hypothetical protein n=1 Tax=Rhodococcus sp. T7 TaxID=627444 RepID=UPI00135C1EC0|nr:hypothetical protein [Rhodococcus sp. T7]